MKTRVITLENNEVSKKATDVLINSSVAHGNDFEIEPLYAVTPEQVPMIMNANMFQWSYPIDGVRDDFATGMHLKAYPTQNIDRRIACFLSHWLCWKQAVETNEAVLVLEHDAIFIGKFDPQEALDSKFGAIGINDPRGATRRSQEYHKIVETFSQPIQQVPAIDEFNIPQGMAGNSAYIIKPALAKSVIDKFKEIGMWPNDALLCKQLFPMIGQTKTDYTTVQGTESTTSL